MLSSSLRRACRKGTDASCVFLRCTSTGTSSRSEQAKLIAPDIKRITATARHLVEGAKQSENPKWRHTYGKKGMVRRLEEDLLANKDPLLRVGEPDPTIISTQPIENWTVEDFVQSTTSPLHPGAYVEFRRSAGAIDGIIIGAVKSIGYNEDTVCLTLRGEVTFLRSSDAMFAIPNFVDRNLAERCGTNPVHEDEHQLAARLRVLKAARDFDRAVEKQQNRYGRLIRDIYPQVRAQSPDEWGKVTTMQVARMLNAAANVPVVTLKAVHGLLMDRSDEFVCHPSRHRFVHSFDVRPLSHLKNIERVRQIIHDKTHVLRKFQEKAKALIDRSRELAKDSLGEPPARAEIVKKKKFSPEEQDIISFLKLSMNLARKTQQDPYEVNVPYILKDTFRYEELITSYTTLRFLREIGVFTPWEDLASMDRDLYVPSTTEESLVHPVTTTSTEKATTSTKRTPGLLTADPHESVRHDFGDLPVYVVDDVNAEELDDGVSFEPVPGEPNSTWLHVHVADPTAVVPVAHPLGEQIRKRTETYYFGHQSIPMLPDDVAALCDMGREGVHKVGQNVLTFSAKIGPTGKILDYKVRAGRVRNVHKLQYEDVNKVLIPTVQPYHFSPFELDVEQSWETRDVSYVLSHVNDLKLGLDLSQRLAKDRLTKDAFTYTANNAEVVFLDKPVLQNPPHVTQPILYRGYPRLRYLVVRIESSEVGARGLIAECMKVAGRVASRFCLDHNIPAIRRAMPRLDVDADVLSRLLAHRDNAGFVPPVLLAREGVTLPPSELTVQPRGHWALGIPDGEGYARITSPLRRAEDMITHWQIKSALLPGGGTPPPFDEVRLSQLLDDLNGRKQTLKRAYRAHFRQWTHTYIRRFMDEQQRAGTTLSESNPLRGLEGYVMQHPVYNSVRWSEYQDILIPKLGLTGVMPVRADSKLPVGEQVKVNVKNVFAYDLYETLELELA